MSWLWRYLAVTQDNTVSKQHARIEVVDGRAFIQPFETANNTKLNKKKVLSKDRLELHVGDELTFGNDGPYLLIDESGILKQQVQQSVPPKNQISQIGVSVSPLGEKAVNAAGRKTDEKISLTSPDAKYWVDQRIKSRLTEDGIINKHAHKMKEGDAKKAKLEELNTRRLLLEEKVKTLKHLNEEANNQVKNAQEAKRRQEEEVSQGRDSFTKVGSYQKALEGFAAEVHRKIQLMQSTNAEKNQVLKELSKKEFIRQYEKEVKGVQDLRDKFVGLQKEIDAQRDKMKARPARMAPGVESK